jgi:hypothetical protein
LIAEDPPRTFPRGHATVRLFRLGWGAVLNFQSYFSLVQVIIALHRIKTSRDTYSP